MNQPKRPVKLSKASTPGSENQAGNAKVTPKGKVPPRGGKGKGRPTGPGSRPRASSARPSPAAKATAGAGATTAPQAKAGGGQDAAWERRRQQRQRRNLATIASAVVVAVVVVLIVVKVSSGSGPSGSTAMPASVANQVTSVSVAELVSAAKAAPTGTASGATVTPPGALAAPPLTSGGKPEVFYEGAEYCPYCAAERWPMVMALSKFGTFTKLQQTKSSSSDTNANTPTFSFDGSSFTSPYLVFTPVETEDRVGAPLQKLTAAQTALSTKYDNAPYVSSANSIPFVIFGGKYVVSGAEFDAAPIAGDTVQQASDILTAPSSTSAAAASKLGAVSLAAKATAGHLVGVLCSVTGDQPASVCSQVPASLKQAGKETSGKGSK